MLKEQRVGATESRELVQESNAQPNAEPFPGGSLWVGEQCGFADQNRMLVQEQRTEDQYEEAQGSDSTSIDDIPLSTYCANCITLKAEAKQLKAENRSLQRKLNRLEKNNAHMTEALTKAAKCAVTSTKGCQTEDMTEELNFDEEMLSDDQEESGMDPYFAEEIEAEAEKALEHDEGLPMEVEPISSSSNEESEYLEHGDDNVDDKNAGVKERDPNLRLETEGKDCREEPKGIVFLSKLMVLFQICHLCRSPNPDVTTSQSGTMISVHTKCKECQQSSSWTSQPMLLGKFPAGNLLLSFAILCAGASVKKVLLVLKHINILVYNESTYYYHQKHLLIPTIVTFWRKFQNDIQQKLNGKEVSLAGDARHDSVGHSAKYGTYTIFCCTIGLIINIVLIQANEVGSSSGMEFEGHRRSIMLLLATGMIIKEYITDRHTSICKWMREECPKICAEMGKGKINHFFDLWHIAKKIQKKLLKLSKERGCELIGRWRKACVSHFYWSAISTPALQGEVKLAKFQSFLYHIINKHKDLPSKIFNKCKHGVITVPKAWMLKGSEAYEKLYDTLTKESLSKAIKQASSNAQTSCLEGFHSVINQFAPKMYAFSYLGMLSRNILAALHFNYNINREPKKDDQGQAKLRVTYIKYKYGDGTVREAKTPQNYDYVKDIYKTLLETPREELQQVKQELEETVPGPIHNMLEREDKNEALRKYKERKERETPICPPTCTDEELEALTQPTQQPQTTARKTPSCRQCGQPMKGHKRGQCSS